MTAGSPFPPTRSEKRLAFIPRDIDKIYSKLPFNLLLLSPFINSSYLPITPETVRPKSERPMRRKLHFTDS